MVLKPSRTPNDFTLRSDARTKPAPIDAAVLVESPVFGGNERLPDVKGNL